MKYLLITIGLISLNGLCAQNPAGAEELVRELLEKGQTGEAEELYASVTRYIDQPVDLNNCNREDLAGTGIFTPFQVFAILDQRERYGPFFSIYELAAIPGINREFLEEIRLMITFSEKQSPAASPRFKGMIMTNAAYRHPPVSGIKEAGQKQPEYMGNPLKFTQRIQLSYGDNISLATAFDKDPGEPWTNRQRPEHLTGYITYAPGTIIEKVVLGNFRIHRGMGLLHQLGFNTRGNLHTLNGYRRSYGKPFASTMEYDYFRGIYAAASKGKLETDIFFSGRPVDVSFFRLDEKGDLFEMTRKTGLHRTSGERQGFDLAQLLSAGTSLNISDRNYYAGCAFTGARMLLTPIGKDSLQHLDPKPATRAAATAYAVLFSSNYELFGEAVLDHTLQSSYLLGGSVVINPALSGDISVSGSSSGYLGVLPGTAKNKGEFKLRLGILVAPFKYSRIRLYHELSKSGQGLMATASLVPEQYTTIECKYGKGNSPEVTLRYTGKSTPEILPGKQAGNSTYENELQQHFRIHYRWEPHDKLILQGRFEISLLRESILAGANHAGGMAMAIGSGSMIYQQVQLIPWEGYRITYRYLIFNVDDWKNRIYTYEPGIKYSFLFPSWYGKGNRNIVVISAKVHNRITFRGKWGLTVYAHRWETGSGNDTRSGNRLMDVEFQLELNLR